MNQVYTTHEVLTNNVTWKSLLAQTYRMYQERFWLFFRMGLPVALLAYLYRPTQRFLLHRILANPDAANWRWHHPGLYAGIGILLAFIEGAFYWLTSALFFAAVAVNVVADAEDGFEPWRNQTAFELMTHAYAKVRKRLGSLLAVGFFSWILFFLGRAAVAAAVFPLMNHFRARGLNNLNVLSLLFSFPILVFAGFLLSRLALAIPELMDNFFMSVRESIRNSIRKSRRWRTFFIFFMIKSGIVAYAVYWLAELGLAELWNRTPITESLNDWLAWAVYICIAAMLESPLFIAFSILYRESNKKHDEALTAPAIG